MIESIDKRRESNKTYRRIDPSNQFQRPIHAARNGNQNHRWRRGKHKENPSQDSRRGSYAFRTRSSEKSGAMTHAQYKTRWCARPCTHFHARAAHTPTLGLSSLHASSEFPSSSTFLWLLLSLPVNRDPDPLFLRRCRGVRYTSWNLGVTELGTGPNQRRARQRRRRYFGGIPESAAVHPDFVSISRDRP